MVYNFILYILIIVFLVCKGNLKGIKDWDDLMKKGIFVIILNLKMSGGVCWNYLVVWVYVKNKYNGDNKKVEDFMGKFYGNVEVLDLGVCGVIIMFVEWGIGDVLIVWENEVYLLLNELGKDKFEIVILLLSILVELFVVVVDKVVEKKGIIKVVKVYLKYLYIEKG